MSSVAETLAALRVLPVLTVHDADAIVELATALRDGSIAGAEITLRTPAGLAAIARAAVVEGFAVGAGTVLRPDDIDRVAEAGASFAVAPGLDPAVVERALTIGLPMLPGIATPTELQVALGLGLDAVKVFPAASLGGPGFLRALAGPFPGVGFLPSGGIGLADARAYLEAPGVLAVSGSWMTPPGATPEQVLSLAAETVEALR